MGALVASTLLFSPAQAADRVLDETDVDLSYTRTAGSNTFLEDGVRVKTVGQTSQSKAAGYFPVSQPLAAVGEPSLDWVGTSPQPGKQLVVDFDGSDATTDDRGTLVGEPVYGQNWWLPGNTLEGTPVKQSVKDQAPKVGGGGSPENGTLDQWRAAFPNAKVTRGGWSLGSGIEGEGTIFSISIGADDYYFSKGEVVQKTLYASDVVPRDTRSAGRNTFRPTGGVRIYTLDSSGQAKATGYFDVNEPLAEVGEPVWDFRLTQGGEPGKQLVIDLDGNSETTDDLGILVGESVYGTTWWLTGGSSAKAKAAAPRTGGGSGSNWFGTLNEWRQKAPNATVLEGGWSLGSGVKGDGVLSSFTIGLTNYLFSGKNRAPSANDVGGSTREGDEPIEIELEGSDPDTASKDGAPSDTLTYTVDGAEGDATVEGDTLTYRAGQDVEADFTDDFTYTVSDGRGGEATAAVEVQVTANKAPTTTGQTLSTTPGQPVDFVLNGTDPEGDPLTYAIVNQGTNGNAVGGREGTFTPNAGFTGTASFTYRVSDDRGGSAIGTVTVNVRKLASTIGIYKTIPAGGKVTTKSTLYVYAEVKINGVKPPKGTPVQGYSRGKLAVEGVTNGSGQVKLTYPGKLPKGSSRIRVTYPGSATAETSTTSIVVKVTK